jgi:uncharacterized protein YcbX
MQIRELRRFPVKSMGGESLDWVVLNLRGLPGDRWFAVEDSRGYFASGKSTRRFRRRDAIFNYAATTHDDHVVVRRDDRTWVVGDPALDAELSAAMGLAVRVTAEGEISHQDAGQVSLVGTASLVWCQAQLRIDADPRRIRANILVETAEAFVEDTWVGQVVGAGEARLRVVERIERCRMVDLAQDGVATTTPFLKALAAARDVRLGVYAAVVMPGRLAVGDAVTPLRSLPPRLAVDEGPA